MNTKSNYYTKHREVWVEGAIAKEAQFQHQLRLEHLGAGLADLSFTTYHHPYLGEQVNYRYNSGSTSVTITKQTFETLKAESKAQRISYGTNGAGEYFEVWGGK